MKFLIKLKRLFLKNTICKIKGHEHDYTLYHNGRVKYTDIQLYQHKCKRCNRYFGKKIK